MSIAESCRKQSKKHLENTVSYFNWSSSSCSHIFVLLMTVSRPQLTLLYFWVHILQEFALKFFDLVRVQSSSICILCYVHPHKIGVFSGINDFKIQNILKPTTAPMNFLLRLIRINNEGDNDEVELKLAHTEVSRQARLTSHFISICFWCDNRSQIISGVT